MQYGHNEYIGRDKELIQVRCCLKAKRNILIEGPVGVGKTSLALTVVQELGIPVFRVDGDQRYSEQKLTGWFDPPEVLKKGYNWRSFTGGPLVDAMQQGGVLFINELNRLPEGVQNVLLPAIDERVIFIPRLGEVKAHEQFRVIATQNPKEFVATSHLSEAILDRFELVVLEYQTEAEEIEIVSKHLASVKLSKDVKVPVAAVRLVRLTRDNPRVRRGASVRAALSIAEITSVFMQDGMAFSDAFLTAALMSLPTRIEIERGSSSEEFGNGKVEQSIYAEVSALIRHWVEEVLAGNGDSTVKKKN